MFLFLSFLFNDFGVLVALCSEVAAVKAECPVGRPAELFGCGLLKLSLAIRLR